MATDAALIALARTLYPSVTEALVSDATLEAALPWARQTTGAASWGPLHDTGIATLLAARGQTIIDAASGGGSGLVSSLSTRSLSASFALGSYGTDPIARQLEQTPAGRDWLIMRSQLPDYVLPMSIPTFSCW